MRKLARAGGTGSRVRIEHRSRVETLTGSQGTQARMADTADTADTDTVCRVTRVAPPHSADQRKTP